MRFLALIPARYASTRFPGKPLADIAGKTMIERVYDRVTEVFPDHYVATDDSRIEAAVRAFGGNVVMTSAEHRSGTDRCREALDKIEASTGIKYDVVINVQGDEPFIAAEQLDAVKSCFDDPATDIATLVKPFGASEDISNPNSPKVVLDRNGFALYFSRSVIPYIRGEEFPEWQKRQVFLKHIGLYGYRCETLRKITLLQAGELEKCESLEQLRWLENGYKIKTAHTVNESFGIDTPEDLDHAVTWMAENNMI